MSKLIQNGTMYLKNIMLPYLSENFKTEYSIDCTDSDLTFLPDGLEVGGDLIIGNAYIEELPKGLIVGGNIIMLEKELKLPQDAIVGGKVITPTNEYYPSFPVGHYIKTDDGFDIIYRKVRILTPEDIIADDFYYPELRYYKSLNPKTSISAVQYTENGQTYTFSCQGVKDAKSKVDWHRAKIKGIDQYKDYNIDELRTVAELKEIYQVCTGACESGVRRFLKEFNIDLEKKYTIRELRRMVMHLPFPGGSAKMVFLEYFNPNK